MSDTPRTEDAMGLFCHAYCVPIPFARTLERELAAANARIAGLVALCRDLCELCDAILDEYAYDPSETLARLRKRLNDLSPAPERDAQSAVTSPAADSAAACPCGQAAGAGLNPSFQGTPHETTKGN